MTALPVRHLPRAALALAALWAAVDRVAAAEHPPTWPSKDAMVVFPLPRQGTSIQVMYSGSQHVVRTDLVGDPQRSPATVFDADANQAVVLFPRLEQYAVIEPPLARRLAFGIVLDQGARWTAQGPENIAGMACTRWRYQTSESAGDECVTADGVPVQIHANGRVFQASSVIQQALDSRLFQTPASYERVAPPATLLDSLKRGYDTTGPK